MGIRPLAVSLLVAVLAAGCATEDAGPGIAAPDDTVTVTVTETVTPTTAEPTPTDTPSPTETAASDPIPQTSVCAEVKEAGGESLAFVFVEQPLPGADVTSGFEVVGCSNSFEATFEWELLDAEGSELASSFGTASCGTGCVGDFSFTVDYTVAELQVGTLRVFTRSAEDGSIQDLNAIPLRLQP